MLAFRDLIRLARPPAEPRDCCVRCGQPIARPDAAVRLRAGAVAHSRCATYQRTPR